VVSASDPPTAVNLSFLDRSRYFSFKYLLIYPHEAEWTPFQTHCYSENVVAPGIESGTSGSVDRNSDHFTTESVSNRVTTNIKSFQNKEWCLMGCYAVSRVRADVSEELSASIIRSQESVN
jgi:hypothetical protein